MSGFSWSIWQHLSHEKITGISCLINSRHILGEALSSLSLKELKNLESRLEKGLSRVRSRKVQYENEVSYNELISQKTIAADKDNLS